MISRAVTAAYVQTPFRVTYRSIDLREPGPGEILLDVLACGVCGYDMETAGFLADKPQPFGHEIVGVVREIGPGVERVAPGEQVVLESGSFCCDCADCRDGRVDLCNRGANIWTEPVMGFSEALIAPTRAVVPAPDIDPLAAVLAEPCGVSLDLVRVAEIGITDRVLIVGAGPIGLMATSIARRLTTNTLAVANRSSARLADAQRMGADVTVNNKDADLAEFGRQYGGFNKILVTAPPEVIPDCIKAAAFGAYIVFLGSNFKEGGVVPIDTHALHFGKMQLRSSFASPALYLPEALHLLRTGVIPAREIVSHRFPLSRLGDAMRVVREERDKARKVVVIPDSRFESLTTGGVQQ